jgi:hypothetical protein
VLLQRYPEAISKEIIELERTSKHFNATLTTESLLQVLGSPLNLLRRPPSNAFLFVVIKYLRASKASDVSL